MAAACHQHHGFARLQRALHCLGHAGIAGDLDAGHGWDLRLGQQAAVAFTQRRVLPLQCGGGQVLVPVGVTHGRAHVGARQVAAPHRHPGRHRRHGHFAVGGPGPGGVVPLQSGLHLRLAGGAGQVAGAVAALGHLHHQGRQLPPRREPRHHVALQALVIGGIVPLAQQQDIGGQQRLQTRCVKGGGCGKVCRRRCRGRCDAGTRGQQQGGRCPT